MSRLLNPGGGKPDGYNPEETPEVQEARREDLGILANAGGLRGVAGSEVEAQEEAGKAEVSDFEKGVIFKKEQRAWSKCFFQKIPFSYHLLEMMTVMMVVKVNHFNQYNMLLIKQQR